MSEQANNSDISPDVIRYNSTITQTDRVYRTQDGCFGMFHSKAWGYYLMKISDPDANPLSEEELNGIKLNKDFPRIPADLWSRWIALCFYMCPQHDTKVTSSFHDRQLEVQVCLLRDEATLSKWKIVVPKQVVSGVSVSAHLNDNIDIATGEVYDQFPPQGWLHAGTSHSHNTMSAFFSSVDDKSELTCPGFHVVIGNIDHTNKQYTYASSIVLRKMRKLIDIEECVDTKPMRREFHEDVLDYIDTVVSANKKIYDEDASDKNLIIPWLELEKFKETEDGADEIDLDDIDDLDDLDFLDVKGSTHFPHHDAVFEFMDFILSDGYTVTDILLSLRKAKEEYDVIMGESIIDDDEQSSTKSLVW